jgi:hypothetical protein
MPAQPQWLLRLPEIIDEISALDAPVVDRSVIERVFRVRRRRAIHLLGWFGGYQVGRTYLVDREALLLQLRQAASGERFGYEKRRRDRLGERLERLRKDRQAARVVIPVAPPTAREIPGLPAGVSFQPGRLVVEYRDVPELLGKLYGIAQAAAADFAGFEAAAAARKAESA